MGKRYSPTGTTPAVGRVIGVQIMQVLTAFQVRQLIVTAQAAYQAAEIVEDVVCSTIDRVGCALMSDRALAGYRLAGYVGRNVFEIAVMVCHLVQLLVDEFVADCLTQPEPVAPVLAPATPEPEPIAPQACSTHTTSVIRNSKELRVLCAQAGIQYRFRQGKRNRYLTVAEMEQALGLV